MKNQVSFWIQFFLLSFLLQLPLYLIDLEYSTFFPSSTKTDGLAILFYRDNFDVFRLCFEFSALVTFLFLLNQQAGFMKKKKNRLGKILFKIFIPVYIFFLIYMIYEAGILKLYGHEPILLDDLYLLKNVLPVFLTEFSFGNLTDHLLILFIVVLVVYGLVKWLRYFLKTIQLQDFNFSNKIAFAVLWIFMIVNTVYTLDMYKRGQYEATMWLTKKARRHIAHAQQVMKNGAPQLLQSPKDYEVYSNYFSKKIETQPDIYLLFIESYGRLLYSNPELFSTYKNFILQKEKTLREHGWHSVSAFSKAQNSGGKSWYSYTSMMSGIKIQTQLEYHTLLKDYSNYPHLVRYLKANDYEAFRMNTIPNKKTKNMIPFADYDKYYAFDRWVKNEDIPFDGHEFELFSSMPDQYAMNYFHEKIERDTAKPQFLFFISLNSHIPWSSVIPFHQDWEKLDSLSFEIAKTKQEETIAEGIQLKKYNRAIEYQLDYLTDFIINQADSNSIFIIPGDHQPPMITNVRDGFDVPIHIISKNKNVTDSFLKYGFENGMLIRKDGVASLRHEGFYSLFVKVLLENFGKNDESVKYLPDGLIK